MTRSPLSTRVITNSFELFSQHVFQRKGACKREDKHLQPDTGISIFKIKIFKFLNQKDYEVDANMQAQLKTKKAGNILI